MTLGGYFVWIQFNKPFDKISIEKAMKEFKVSVKIGPIFSLSKNWTDSMRLSFAYYDEQHISEGVERLSKAIKSIM